MINILCFGDSITLGQADSLSGGWADQLKRDFFAECQDKTYQEINLFNLGIGGENTDGLKQRFESEFRSRFIKGQTHLIIFQYGANDIVIHKNKNIVPENYFIRNLTHCIELAKKAKAQVLILGLLPIADEFDGQVNQHGDIRKSSDIKRYNQILEKLALELKCEFLDFYTTFSENKQNYLATDGLHPNSEGHQLLCGIIKEKLNSYVLL